MIIQAKRVITDKATDVTHDIRLYQTGYINCRLRRNSLSIAVPCDIRNPESVTVTAKTASAGRVFKDTFYCDLSLKNATNSTIQTLLTKPTNPASYGCKKGQLMLHNNELFVANQDLTAAQYASPSLVPTGVANDYWEKVENFNSTSKFLIITTYASTAAFENVGFTYKIEGVK